MGDRVEMPSSGHFLLIREVCRKFLELEAGVGEGEGEGEGEN